MNEHSLNDPELKSLEARLAGLAPQLSPPEQQQLLYECGVAAGRAAGRKSLRRWQGTTAILCVVIFAVSVLPSRDSDPVADHRSRPSGPVEVTQPETLVMEIPATVRQESAIDLDAWQTSSNSSSSHELAWDAETDPHLRSLTVGALTRSLLSPRSK